MKNQAAQLGFLFATGMVLGKLSQLSTFL